MRFFALLLLLAALLCGAAFADMENAVPSVGDTIGEFTVTKSEPFDVYGGQLITLCHEKSGGQVVWMANDDAECSFVIGFLTHYDTDTGVPHVFEHAALSGSEKYPDSGLFFSMLSQVYQTYLNASTNTFWTDYKAASLSDRQLLKMADTILAGVFHPLVVTDSHAMMREAYRYELADAEGDIKLTGTVYSEMQGAYYTNARNYIMLKELFPGSWHATCAGGKPGVIEQMTQQDLADFHDTYYIPSNAVTMLYGDLDLEAFLELIAGYYNEYTPAEVSQADPGFTPIEGSLTIELDVPASANEAERTDLIYAIPLRGYSDMDVYMLRSFLDYAIDNSSSSFYRILTERFPNSSAGVSMLPASMSAEPMLVILLNYANDVNPDDFVAAVNEGLAANLEEGIRYDVIEAELKSSRIGYLRIREKSNVGISFSESLLGHYAETGELYSYADRTAYLLTESESWLASGMLESVIAERLINPADSRLLVMTKRPGSLEEINAANAQTLVDMKASMSEEEINAMVESTADYNAWLADTAANSQIDEVRALTVSELPLEITTFTAEESEISGARVITSDTGDSRLVEFCLYFDAASVPAEDLVRYAAAVRMLGSLSTSKHSYAEIDRLTSEYGISITVSDIGPDADPDICRPVLKVRVSCLREDIEGALSTVWEILTETRFDENDRIRYCARLSVNNMRNSVQSKADEFALMYANAITTARGRYKYETALVPFLSYLESAGGMDDSALAAEAEAWQGIITGLINRSGLALTVVSGSEGIDDVIAAATPYIDSLPDEARAAADYSALEPLPQSIAVIIAGSANYNLKQLRADESGTDYSGKLNAVASLVKDKLLIPVMRYKNGVYSPKLTLSQSSYWLMAYRDPSIAVTYDEVLPALGGMVRGIELTQEELDSYIISAFSALAKPMGPIAGANAAVSDVLCGNTTFENKKAAMESLRTLEPCDIAEYAGLFDALSAKGCTVTFGSAASIKAEAERFDMIETWFVSSGK